MAGVRERERPGIEVEDAADHGHEQASPALVDEDAFVRSSASTGSPVWSSADRMTGRRNAMRSAAAMPLPETSAMTTPRARGRPGSEKTSKKSPPIDRAGR